MTEVRLKENPHPALRTAHTLLHKLTPLALLALLVYLLGTHQYDVPEQILFSARVFFVVFFATESIVDFALYEDKWMFFRQFWVKALLLIPALGVLRLIGRLALAGTLLKGIKFVGKTYEFLRRAHRTFTPHSIIRRVKQTVRE